MSLDSTPMPSTTTGTGQRIMASSRSTVIGGVTMEKPEESTGAKFHAAVSNGVKKTFFFFSEMDTVRKS